MTAAIDLLLGIAHLVILTHNFVRRLVLLLLLWACFSFGGVGHFGTWIGAVLLLGVGVYFEVASAAHARREHAERVARGGVEPS